ncbi:hypothetical protein GGTG_11808 [Gaeumannomyces tritici R3-111a-1]|uniref:Uncharacterized protein n=1 Tax=Gaeumannomyces tritici (strain R3-111a-1) TaxID=644352 RepID=J3PE85_GAET3|nr:hypothetical protein GGTG_11808 [Gaeumannomyces tritici R3-111a-1]EJT70785.1 hypothetical protein GGTG_11808 [Gaeumannomyces tritici R3-111a-1]
MPPPRRHKQIRPKQPAFEPLDPAAADKQAVVHGRRQAPGGGCESVSHTLVDSSTPYTGPTTSASATGSGGASVSSPPPDKRNAASLGSAAIMSCAWVVVATALYLMA